MGFYWSKIDDDSVVSTFCVFETVNQLQCFKLYEHSRCHSNNA